MSCFDLEYDVVVVGCGLAGAAAGKAAASNGAKTLIIDKKFEIGNPVYEAAASIYDISELEEIAGIKFNRERVVASKLYGIAYIPESGRDDNYHEWTDGAIVRRTDLEKELAIDAARAGAKILLKTKFLEFIYDVYGKIKGVRAERNGEIIDIKCKSVIGCDGATGILGEKSGIDLPYSITTGFGIEYTGVKRVAKVSKPIYEMYMVKALPGVTCWVTPRGDDIFAVGVGAHLSSPEEKSPLKEYFETFIDYLEKNGRYDFSNAAEIQHYGGVTTGVVDVERLACDGCIVTGDAARRPIFGSGHGGTGMPSAVFTGKCAGETMAEAVKKSDFSGDSLQSTYKSKINASFKDAKKEKEAIAEAKKYNGLLNRASAKMQDKAIEAVGSEYSKLHLYTRGGVNYADCTEKLKEFWNSVNS